MKQTIKILALLLMPFLMISSCTDDEMPVSVVASSTSKTLSLSANYITTGYESTSTTLTVKASSGVSWMFSNIPSWISVSPSSGYGSGTVTIDFAENTSTTQRSQTLFLKNTDQGWQANIKLDIVQAGKEEKPDNPQQTYEGVDLGLSVLWATFNVGATSPEGYGDYYAWGETETKSFYDWNTYKWCQGTDSTLTKYVGSAWSDLGYNGYYDDILELQDEDDVAHVKWGEKWRIPSYEEVYELYRLCTWTWTTVNGVNGYLVESNVEGYSGRSIFLPASGIMMEDAVEDAEGSGWYWTNRLSSNVASSYSSFLYLLEDGHYIQYLYYRCLGFTVRPVATSDKWKGITSLTIDRDNLTISVGADYVLSAHLWGGSADYSFMYNASWSSDNESVATVSSGGLITGISAGTATITASYNGLTATCFVTVRDYYPVTEYVDLGLSVNWATCNIGAMAPEENGYYYAWGETETKDYFHWSSYKYCEGSNNTFTKYCNDSSVGKDGYTDELTTLVGFDDAANLYLSEYGEYRMPTKEEFEELIENCTWKYTYVNGVNGYQITSNVSGYEDCSIFLPLAGYRSGYNLVPGNLTYWSSQLNTSHPASAWCLNSNEAVGAYNRAVGGTIRPVIPSSTWTNQQGEFNSEYVDLGLPSGVMWADRNLGASNPEDYGKYYTWGETQPKKEYSWSTYTWAGGTSTSLTKYNTRYEYGDVDNLTELELADDAAYVNLGEKWRIPTRADYEELFEYCSWTWTQKNGHNGYLVTGPNRNSIFLPAAGSYGADYIGDISQAGYYWTNALYTNQTDCAWSMAFSETEMGVNYVTGRPVCASIRPVYDRDLIPPKYDGVHNSHEYVDLGLSVKWATCNVGASEPEGYGDYYAWGETSTQYKEEYGMLSPVWKEGKEDGYTWASYSYCSGSNTTLSKYCSLGEYGNNGYFDDKTILEAMDDVAQFSWGGNWRMARVEEFYELLNSCTWEWTTRNGINGFNVTSNIVGYKNKSIFLPASGHFYGTVHYDFGTRGSYWSGSLNTSSPDYAYYIYFFEGSTKGYSSSTNRHNGFSIRPVLP